jgi:hypothetical protein
MVCRPSATTSVSRDRSSSVQVVPAAVGSSIPDARRDSNGGGEQAPRGSDPNWKRTTLRTKKVAIPTAMAGSTRVILADRSAERCRDRRAVRSTGALRTRIRCQSGPPSVPAGSTRQRVNFGPRLTPSHAHRTAVLARSEGVDVCSAADHRSVRGCADSRSEYSRCPGAAGVRV